MRCVGFVLVFWDAMMFCNNFARWLQKIVATWRVGFLGCYDLCNNFARWLQKIVATWDARCWFSGMCWFFWDVLVFLGCYDLLYQLCKVITKDHSSNMWYVSGMCWFFLGCSNMRCIGFSGMLWSFVTDPEIPDWKMFIRARNAVWMSKRAIGILGLVTKDSRIPENPAHRITCCDYLL